MSSNIESILVGVSDLYELALDIMILPMKLSWNVLIAFELLHQAVIVRLVVQIKRHISLGEIGQPSLTHVGTGVLRILLAAISETNYFFLALSNIIHHTIFLLMDYMF